MTLDAEEPLDSAGDGTHTAEMNWQLGVIRDLGKAKGRVEWHQIGGAHEPKGGVGVVLGVLGLQVVDDVGRDPTAAPCLGRHQRSQLPHIPLMRPNLTTPHHRFPFVYRHHKMGPF